ncbi:MAG TPA: succinate dehydrogenase iron-sulfur subunit [bacterium]|nr:succinate dehydrogenase iron-sulfur subunit [bacterium]
MTPAIAPGAEITFHVRRYTPGKDARPSITAYRVPLKSGMTVLDGLYYIKENLDQSLTWRSSCRMGVCGACGMLVNGSPRLACNTQILEVARGQITLGPLPNFDIIRDLVPDLTSMIEKHQEIMPFIQREDQAEIDNPDGEYYQSPGDLERYLQFSFCIKCGCCMAACPTLATDIRYLGPMPLAQALRYNNDSRDGGAALRTSVAASRHGVFRCHFAGECSRVCPKGVDPAKAIQLLKGQLVAGYLGLGRRKRPCTKLGPASRR